MKNIVINPNDDAGPSPDLQPILDIDLEATHLSFASEEAQLVGSGCQDCGENVFPAREVCFYCGGRKMERVLMPTQGTLYSYSTVYVSASRPVPYTIGYVDLDNGVRLLAAIGEDSVAVAPDCRVKLEVRGQSFQFVAMECEL